MKKFLFLFIVGIFALALIIGAINDADDETIPVAFVDMPEELISEESVIEVPNVAVEETAPEPEPEPVATQPKTVPSSVEIPRLTEPMPEQILVREGYTASYNKNTKCPNWVAWHLTKEHTDGPYNRKGVPYYDETGNAIGIGPVNPDNQRGGYFLDRESEIPRQLLTDWFNNEYRMTHGHLCPAADNKWSKAAMNQSFLLTNMCPQEGRLNGGAWQKLEDKCRTWAKQYGDIYIVAGPVYNGKISRTIGASKVAVPDAFFKVVLCLKGTPKAIGFIYTNDTSRQSMSDAVRSVDAVEEITSIDFFYSLADDVETVIERQSNLNNW